jgi:hypothetical protein
VHEAAEGDRAERGAGLDDVGEGVPVGARRGGVAPHLEVEQDCGAVLAVRREPADEPVPWQRRRGGAARERGEHRDGVAEPAREHVHADEPSVERQVGGESTRRDGVRVDLEAQREVGRGDAAAQELQQAVCGRGIRDGRRGGEGSGGEAAWPRWRLEAAVSEAHGSVDGASRARGRRRSPSREGDGEAAN